MTKGDRGGVASTSQRWSLHNSSTTSSSRRPAGSASSSLPSASGLPEGAGSVDQVCYHDVACYLVHCAPDAFTLWCIASMLMLWYMCTYSTRALRQGAQHSVFQAVSALQCALVQS